MTEKNFPPVPCALILAAGYGSRLGGRGKALLSLGSTTLLERAVHSLREGGIDAIRVVTGHRGEEVAAAAADFGIGILHNPLFEQGMLSSLQAGLAHLLPDATLRTAPQAVFILPVDCPLLRPETLRVMIAAWQAKADTHYLYIPTFAGRTGHPPLIGSAHWRAILHWQGEQGLRGYLASLLNETVGEAAGDSFLQGKMPPPSPRRTPLRFIPVPDAGICADIDTPHDYAAAQNFLARTRECRDPTLEECWELLLHSGLLQSTRRHCVAVARGALRLGTAMIRAGKACTLTWHLYGGLLHDVTRQYTDHALRGRQLLRAWDWPDIADIVGAHTTLPPILLQAMNIASCEQPPCRGYGVESPELQVNAPPIFQRLPSPACQHACIAVYLADKFYSGDVQVTLEERFARIEKRFATDPPALAAIQCRKATAMAVSDWFFKLTGTEPGACVGDSHNPDPLEEHLTALSAVFESAPGSPQSRHHPYYHP